MDVVTVTADPDRHGDAPLPEQPGRVPLGTWVPHDLRHIAGAATAGLVVGLLVNGIGSRLAMMLLARLNPQVTGRISDDGFRMGQFTLQNTAGLLVFATAVGVAGGLIYLAVRHLRFGPRWFQLASISVGPAVVVGSMLVHTDGIDFRVLEPTSLAIALFVALPGLFALAVAALTDRWTRPEAWTMRTHRAWTVGLAPLVLLGPLVIGVLVGLGGRLLHHTSGRVRAAVTSGFVPNAARVALTIVFALAFRDLIAMTGTLL